MSRRNREKRDLRRIQKIAHSLLQRGAPQQVHAETVVPRFLTSRDPRPAWLNNELRLSHFIEHSVLVGASISRYSRCTGEMVTRMSTPHGELQYDITPMWEHLGGALVVEYRESTYGVLIPRAQRVLATLEDARQGQLDIARRRVGGSDRMFEALQSTHGRPAWFEQFMDEGAFGSIFIINLMMVYVAVTYKCVPEPSDGWVSGRCLENQSLLATLPPVNEWPQACRDFIARFSVQHVDVGGFALPDGRVESVPGTGAHRRGGERRYDPERINFAMSQPSFRELRGLHFRNPDRYVAAVFSPRPRSGAYRIELDSPFTNNRLFLLEGSLSDCLSVAQLRKGEIRESSICVDHFTHGSAGNWKAKLTRWLESDAD